MSKYLDSDGLLYLWQKAKATFAKVSHTHTTADVTGLDTALTNANKVTDVKVNGTSVVTNKSANITVDSTLSTTSNNPIKNSTVAAKFNSVDSAISGKQDKLTFDNTPKIDSTNPVTSGGVKSALDAKQNKLTFDSAPTVNSTNPVTSGGIYDVLLGKQDTLVFDTEPTENSTNLVKSGGIERWVNGQIGNAKIELENYIGENRDDILLKQDKIPNADKLSIDSSGIIAAKNLPSYVDDVIEVYILADGSVSAGQKGWFYIEREGSRFYESLVNEKGKIYVVVGKIADVAVNVGSATDAGEYQNTQWRWTGSQYVRLTDGSGVSPISNSEIDAIVAQ